MENPETIELFTDDAVDELICNNNDNVAVTENATRGKIYKSEIFTQGRTLQKYYNWQRIKKYRYTPDRKLKHSAAVDDIRETLK
jgi:hypothetical protein